MTDSTNTKSTSDQPKHKDEIGWLPPGCLIPLCGFFLFIIYTYNKPPEPPTPQEQAAKAAACSKMNKLSDLIFIKDYELYVNEKAFALLNITQKENLIRVGISCQGYKYGDVYSNLTGKKLGGIGASGLYVK